MFSSYILPQITAFIGYCCPGFELAMKFELTIWQAQFKKYFTRKGL